MDPYPVIAFGEIVWDQFDNQMVLGGAPLNVAYHLQAQQWPVSLISRVGKDPLGTKTIEKIERLGLPISGIQKDDTLPTGLVLVTMEELNEPSFDIAAPAAWDNIQTPHPDILPMDSPFYLVFGSLAQRNRTSRQTLRHLITHAKKTFYDVNLRPPYTPCEHVIASLQVADVVKVNQGELAELNDWFLQSKGDEHFIGLKLIKTFNLSLLAITKGDKGASLVTRDGYFQHPGFPVKVADPVGSGDAFFSGLITGLLSDLSLEDCLIKANRLGSWVASKTGATPRYTKE